MSMSVVWSEVMRAWRAMLRRPGYFMLATGVLALGIAATVGVGTLIYAVLLRPLPYPQPQQLVSLGAEKAGVAYWTSPMEYQHMLPLHGVQSLGLVARGTVPKNIAADGKPELVQATLVSRSLLPTLGVHLVAGRNFNAEEDRPNGPRAVILGHGFWMRHFGGDPQVVGRQMVVEGASSTIVGVLPAGADIGAGDDLGQGDLLLPLALAPDSIDDGMNERAIARVSPDTSLTRLGSELQVRMRALHARAGGPFADYYAHEHYRADDLQTVMRVRARPVLLMFLASALALLLIALINLANLMLLRSLSRSHDAAVRHALGAPWLRRMLPVLAEGLLIGLAAVVVGCLLAAVGLRLLGGLVPAGWIAGGELRLSAPMGWVAVAMGLLGVAMAVGLGLWHGRTLSVDALREGGRSGLSRRSGLLGRTLVVAQVSLATALLCTSGLFLHALYDAAHDSLGFNSEGVLTFELSPVQGRYPDAAAVRALTRQLVERLRAIPGVAQVSVGTGLPAGDRSQNFYLGNIHRPGEPPPDHDTPQFRAVDAAFFPAFEIPVREGRAFDVDDRAGSEPVAIVNQVLAQRMYGGHALGQTIDYTAPLPGGGGRAYSLRIVGVIGTISPFGPLGDRDGMLYVPLAQMPDSLLELYRIGNALHFALRGHGDPMHYQAALTAALAAVAPEQPLAQLRSMQQVVHETSDAARLNLLLVGLFASLAVLLAAVGLYAVVAMSAASREREFGVRLALGASPEGLMRLVLRGGLAQVMLGVLIGLCLAVGASGTLRAVLAQINRGALDPTVMTGVAVILVAIGLLSCAVPAWRAARVHPMRALRGD
jgi:putative ABC transport system permease protein